ncbi:MAG: hypothetical protein H6825_03405 [Planctomycetes bacterium]|nr:hypothetical protein [Planctomycetota bacterium]
MLSLLLVAPNAASAPFEGPQDHEWGDSAPTVYEQGLVSPVVSSLKDFFAATSGFAVNPAVDGIYPGANDEPVVHTNVDCGGAGSKHYELPLYFFHSPTGPNAPAIVGLASYDGEAIALNQDYFDGEMPVDDATWNAQAMGTVMHEGAHQHFQSQLEENGDQACYDQIEQLASNLEAKEEPCTQAFAYSYEAQELCKEANNGTGVTGLGWDQDTKNAMKGLADSANQKCEDNSTICASYQATAGCSLTSPCGLTDACPGDCVLQ